MKQSRGGIVSWIYIVMRKVIGDLLIYNSLVREPHHHFQPIKINKYVLSSKTSLNIKSRHIIIILIYFLNITE